MDEIFDAPEWWEALTLAERAALLSAEGAGEPLSQEGIERARLRADRWRREADLTGDEIFAERLALDGLTPDSFLRVLAEPAAGLRRRAAGRPPWLQLLARTFSTPPPPLPPGGTDDLGVLELLRPLIADAGSRVLETLRRLAADRPGLLDPEAVAASLLATLVRRLRWASERTLALELQIALLEGRLQGETSEERFRSFVETLRRPAEALEILRRYPVLARDACRHAGQWVETGLEMMERITADREEIVRRLLGGEDPGPLTGVEAGLSDRHGGGRSVAILAFAAGARIVYKPSLWLSTSASRSWSAGSTAGGPSRRCAASPCSTAVATAGWSTSPPGRASPRRRWSASTSARAPGSPCSTSWRRTTSITRT